jgi:3-dehydroquinate synthase
LAAALYRRGVRYARVPTTLVGMVDVCVGIKQGINLGSKKNILGAFYPPFGGINDLTFLKSVPQRQLACGIAEIVKMAIVRDPFLFELLEAHTGKLLASHFQTPHRAAEQIVIRAELAMMNELQPNLYESDLQRFVDFGHSFSPALESASHFEINHGEAVAIDMMICTALAVRRGICDESVMRRLGGLYARSGLALTHGLCEAEFLTESLTDIRVHRGGALNLVVPTGIGSATFVQDVTAPEVAVALRDIESLALDVAIPEEARRAVASG